MPIAPTPEFTWDYILECDRGKPKNEQAIFKLKAFSSQEFIGYQNQIGRGNHNAYALLVGLKGWVNYKDKMKNPAPFNMDNEKQVTFETLNYLIEGNNSKGQNYFEELAEAIRTRNVITEDEIKNSESPDAS